MPTAFEIQSHIPASGTTIRKLIRNLATCFEEKKGRFMQLLKANIGYDRTKKILLPMPLDVLDGHVPSEIFIKSSS